MASRWSVSLAFAVVSLAPATASADQQVTLQGLALTVTVPDDRELELRSEVDVFTHADGNYIGSALEPQDAGAIVADAVAPLDGWSGAALDGHAGVWNQFAAPKVMPSTPGAAETPPAPPAPPTPFQRFGPNRYEIGLGRFDEDPDNLFVEAGWGLSAAISRTPWSRPGLTWSYQARLLATGVGVPASAEVGAGLNVGMFAVQAIAGAGAAGDVAPFGVHAGGQIDLLYIKRQMFGPGAGFEASAALLWLDGGRVTRIQGGFIGSSGRRGYELSIAWEQRVVTQAFTFNVAVMRLPDL